MASNEYSKARKIAQRVYRQDMAAGRYPYLKVLDELLSFSDTVGEVDLGLVEIPIERIVGTKTAGRTKAFASNFMPLLDEGTEFSDKWSSLYAAHIDEGIREPIIACEFFNSFYVIEGNKRVSVLKYSGAVNVLGYVTRIVPALTDSRESRVYYEFMDFYRASGINNIYFSRPGSFHALCELIGKPWEENWNEDEKRDFSSCLLHFTDAYQEKGGAKIPIPVGDAFLTYLKAYGYGEMEDRSKDTLKKQLSVIWKELEALPEAGNVNVVLQPEEDGEKSMIQKLASPEKKLLQKLISPVLPKLQVGFLYYKTAETSGWTYSHDLGRIYLEEHLADRISIHVYDGIETDEECAAKLEEAIHDGCSVIFTTSPRFLGPSIKAGMKAPHIKLLNCSLNSYSGHLRTYYGRLYESKFLVGMLAGILTSTDHVGYIADFPIYGSTANINAFALGVKVINPTAQVHLAWATEKNCDVKAMMENANVSHISGRDTIAPLNSSRSYGLYELLGENEKRLAASIWHWGKFYQRILLTILDGSFNQTAALGAGSINYWWGISSGMIDMICSQSIPERTRRLIELIRRQIMNGEFSIFSGELFDQNHTLKNKDGKDLTPEQIIRMDWLLDNVIGHIPDVTELIDEAVPMVKIQGIYSDRDPIMP